jgi:hypothetical protein
LFQIFSGCTLPVTDSPNLGSRSRIVWPPMMQMPASFALSAAPARMSARKGRTFPSSGNAATERANRGSPPMAYTSLRELAAAMAP